MINTSCHGCKSPMSFEAIPVVLSDMDGERRTYWGKDSAAWICKTCRQNPAKLKEARLAAGMPATPSMPAGFDDDELEQEVA